MKEVCPWTYRDNDGTLKEHYEQLHAHKLDDFNEKNQFLERYKLLNLTEERLIRLIVLYLLKKWNNNY